MMKRIIALLLALILTVGLLPTVALAAEGGETPTTGTGDVKNGYYEGTTWKEGPLNQGKLPTGVESVSKTAKPTSNPNEYEVTLEVVLKKTESQENPGSAATVLVLDHSGSMNGCAYCKSTTDDGVNYYHTEGCKYDKPHQWVMVTSEQSRMSAATKAVKDFIKTYSGRFDENGQETTIADLNLGRWVCLVWFNKKGGVTGGGDWVDVSNKSGYQTATNTNGWKAHDGTNLDCGLRLADHWLKQSPVASINKSLKNVIVLSDGEPTFYLSKGVSIKGSIKIGNTTYYVHGSGKDCKKDTYNTTKITAATLRNSASVYTVCFGASGNEIKDYDKNGNQKITVGNYLKQKIATQPKTGSQETFAYDAANADALNKAFAAITNTIVSGLSTGTVKDTLPTGITVSEADKQKFGTGTWELNSKAFNKTEETKQLADGTKETVYTYTKTYTVTIDPDDEKLVTTKDGYAPLNGKTTLTVKNSQGTDVEIPFPIPAGKVTPTKINDKITVTITGATNKETYDGTEKKAEGYTVTISDPRYTTDDFTFNGTDVVKATNASKNQYMMGLKADNFTNNNEKFTNVKFVVNDGWLLIDKKPLTIEANDNTVDYDGKPHGEDGYVATGLAEGDTVESVTFNGSQTNPGTYENLLVPSEAVIKNAKGDDVKDNYIITYTPGTLVINKLTNAITVTITGKQETKEYNGQTQTVTGFDYTVEGGAEKADVTVTLNQTGKDSASGKDVTTENDGKYMMGLTASDFTVSSDKYINVTITTVTDGWLKITPAQVTLTSESGSKDYDGTPLTRETVTVTGRGKTVFESEVTGIKATGTVTDPGPAVTNTITYTPDTNFKETNYNISKSEGKLSINDIAAPTNLPTVNVYCTNTEVKHADSTGNALKNNTYTSVVSKNEKDKYICTITLTDKNSYISDYNTSTGATHTSDTTKTDFTKIILHYDTDAKAWPTPIVNFALNVKCDTPTVNVTYTWDGLDENDFDTVYPAPTKPDNATPNKGSDYTVDPRYDNSSIAIGKDGVRYKFSGWSSATSGIAIEDGEIKNIQTDVTLTGHWTKLGTGTFDLNDKIFKSFEKKQGSKDIPGSEYTFEATVTRLDKENNNQKTNEVYTGTVTLNGATDAAAFVFNNRITFHTGDEYRFLVEETPNTVTTLSSDEQIDYDDAVYYLYVTVSDDLKTINYRFDHVVVITSAEEEPAATENQPITFRNYYDAEKDPDKLYLDFSKYVQKELTATGSKTANDVKFRVIVNGMESPYMMYNVGEEEVSTYAAFDPKYSTVLNVNFASITGGNTETEWFIADNSIVIDQAGIYYFELNEEDGKRTGVTYDDSIYKVLVYVERKDDKLVVKSFDIMKDNVYVDGDTITFHNTIDTGKDDYYPIIIPTIINKDTGMLNKTDHFAYVIGYPDGTVHPNGQITRAEVATIFFRLLKDEVRDGAFTTSNSYSDVAYGKWYNNPISTMSALGIITGYPDGTFKPNKPITRAEFAAIAARFDETQSGKSATFSDVIGHWAAKEIGIAYYNDWIKGYPDGTFKPDQNITRAEAMTLINRVLERKPESPADLLTNMNKWTDNMDTSKWYYLDVQEATNSHGYTRKTFNYELWRQMLPDPDWSRYER